MHWRGGSGGGGSGGEDISFMAQRCLWEGAECRGCGRGNARRGHLRKGTGRGGNGYGHDTTSQGKTTGSVVDYIEV